MADTPHYARLLAEQVVNGKDHRIVVCGSLTGHVGATLALCDSPGDAAAIRYALNSLSFYEARIAELEGVLRAVASQETSHSNATVRRMASIARRALHTEGE